MNHNELRYSARMTDWQKEMTDRIGKRVQELRRDKTALWLSERTEELGMKISRSALSELENGKRKSISLAEFLILALALETSPAMLLYPDYPDGEVEIWPGKRMPAMEAFSWLGGEKEAINAPDPGLSPWKPRIVQLVQERKNLFEVLIELVQGGTDSSEAVAEVNKRQSALNQEIANLGGVVVDRPREIRKSQEETTSDGEG